MGIWDVRKKSEFWKILAERKNGHFKMISTVSRDLNRLELAFEYEKISITFSESDTKPLFVSCGFRGEMGQTWFEISKTDLIEKIIRRFRKHKINAIHGDFNNKYLTRGNDNFKVRSLLNNKKITDLILKQNLTFIGGEREKHGKFNLILNVHRNVNSLEQLESVYTLTTALIDVLEGRKTADKPGAESPAGNR